MTPDAYLEMAETESHHWWFAGRRALLASLISDLRLPIGAKILDVGSGTGGNLEMLATFGDVIALEKDPSARSLAAQNTRGRFDIREGSFPWDVPCDGERFDLICLFDVLEHIEEDIATLASVRTLLAEEGRIVLTVPAYDWLWGPHDEFLHHKRRYTSAQLRTKAAQADLSIERISYFNTFLFPLAVAARLKDRLYPGAHASGTSIPRPILNKVLYNIFKAERPLLRRFSFPYGVSLLGVFRKKYLSEKGGFTSSYSVRPEFK